MKWSLISIYLSIYISTTIFADIFLCTNIFSTLPSIPKPTNNLKKNLVSWSETQHYYLLKDINHLKNIMLDLDLRVKMCQAEESPKFKLSC